MKWNTEYFGFRLVFVGFCGEVPVALLRKTAAAMTIAGGW